VNAPCPVKQASTQFTYPRGMESTGYRPSWFTCLPASSNHLTQRPKPESNSWHFDRKFSILTVTLPSHANSQHITLTSALQILVKRHTSCRQGTHLKTHVVHHNVNACSSWERLWYWHTTAYAPLIHSRHMALYKCVLIDWLIDSCSSQQYPDLLMQA